MSVMKKTFIGHRITTYLTACMVLIAIIFLLTGCRRNTTPISRTGFYFDTVIQITLYDTEEESVLDGCFALADTYEQLFSATLEGSDIWNINHSDGKPVVISAETSALLSTALDYAVMTNGAVDPTVRPLSELWDFGSESEHRVPNNEDIEKALSHVSYNTVHLNDGKSANTTNEDYNGTPIPANSDCGTVTLSDPEAAIDLGFIAKGYIADKMKEYLLSQNVNSACISLGGNVLAIGEKPDKSPFKIGIQEPFAPSGTTLTTVEIKDMSVVTSGIYERCFYENDILYHHVLDTATGYPVENELSGVTILCESSTKADVLSTSCLCLGLSEGRLFLDSFPDVEYLIITRDGELYYSEGFPRK